MSPRRLPTELPLSSSLHGSGFDFAPSREIQARFFKDGLSPVIRRQTFHLPSHTHTHSHLCGSSAQHHQSDSAENRDRSQDESSSQAFAEEDDAPDRRDNG